MTRRSDMLHPPPCPRRKRLEAEQSDREVLPERILALDQVNLPRTLPFLHPALPNDRIADVVIGFEIDETFDAVLSGEATDDVRSMLPYPLRQIGRRADIEGPLA